MLKAIIVDDEARSRQTLSLLVEQYCPTVEVIETASDVLSGVKAIHKLKPDLVFLDIEMPHHSGFSLIEFFDEIDFDIILTTAYEHYALKAFKFPIFGYLLKPIDIDELQFVVDRLGRNKDSEATDSSSPRNSAYDAILHRLQLPTNKGYLYLNAAEVNVIQSQGRYTMIHMLDQTTYQCSCSLKEMIALLKDASFIQVHRSYLINLSKIGFYSKGIDSHIQMRNGKVVDVGKTYKDNLSEVISFLMK